MLRGLNIVILALCLCAAVVSAEENTTMRTLGRGGKIFKPTDVDALLARPYLEHVPMASTGECLWAAHPKGWAFGNGVHYYLLTPDGIGFDLKLSVNGAPLEPSEATSYPSHIALDGASGAVKVHGDKWITAEDAMVSHLTLENTSDAAAEVTALLVLPSDHVQNDGSRIYWEVERHGLKIGLLGKAAFFTEAPAEQEAISRDIFTVEGETPVTQNGTRGPDLKAAASAGRVLGSNFGEVKGHFAEWDIPVAAPINDAVLTFRYALHSAEANALFRITAAGKTLADRYSFNPTTGWGNVSAEFAHAAFDLGEVKAGPLRVRLETVEDGHGVNIDTVSVGLRGVEPPLQQPPVTRMTRQFMLEPHQKTSFEICIAASTDPARRDTALARAYGPNALTVHREAYLGWVLDQFPDFRSDDAMTRQYWHRATSIVKKNLFKVGEGRLKRWAIAEGRWDNSWYPNAISYGVGHQIRETRWLRDPLYVRDMLSTWCENERDNGIFPNYIRPEEIGDGQYTDWIASTAWDAHCVAPDAAKLREWAGALKRNVDGWLKVYDPDNDGLLLVDSHWWTGMEWQPSFFYFNGFDKDKQDQQLERLDLTAYVYGDARNLSRILESIGDTEGATRYAGIADTIAEAVASVMWDPDTNFFYSVEPTDHRKSMVKEVVGVYPFYFSMFKPDSPYAAAWTSILDPEEFWTTWPVASATKKCPAYSQDITFNGEEIGACMWNGPTWPHANSIVLSAMAATLREFPNSPLKIEDFHKLLRSFTLAQFLDQDLQFPWTGEYYSGDDAKWRTTERDYDHSTYIDIIVADYAGLRPRPDDTLELRPLLLPDTPAFVLDGVRYHNHDLTIAWNPQAETNSPDSLIGYRVYIDGRLAHHSKEVPQKVELALK